MYKKPFLVAEISSNHCGDYKLCKNLILKAKESGADAVKIQTYTPKCMTLNSKKKHFIIKNGLWKGYNYWELYKKAHTPIKWHKNLFQIAKRNKIELFSSPFSTYAIEVLEKLNCQIYKVASFEITDLNLIKEIAKTGKEIIISTGCSNIKEINKAYNTAYKYGAKKITLLYCVSLYPAKKSDFNLNNLIYLKQEFKCDVGLSDHSKDNEIAKAAYLIGATLFEKHFALDGQPESPDIKFSLNEKEFKIFKNSILETKSLMGQKNFNKNLKDKKSLKFRRSIFAIRRIKVGDKFTKSNTKVLRPNVGLEPKYHEFILNKNSPFNFEKGDFIPKKIIKLIK